MMMKTLEVKPGRLWAVILPSFFFAVVHISPNMGVADIALLLVAGTCVGIMFSLISIESGSVWYSALVHAVWNICIIGDLMHIGTAPSDFAIWNYTLSPQLPKILTGGTFGIEASLFANIGYLAVAALALYLIKKNHTTMQEI